MTEKYNQMIFVNLHEVTFLEKVLKILLDGFARDMVVIDSEGIQSRHGSENPDISNSLSFLGKLFSEKRNQNYFITAILNQKNKKQIAEKLKEMSCSDRFAASFWFINIEDYFYHKMCIE
jgi:hypothetical protein